MNATAEIRNQGQGKVPGNTMHLFIATTIVCSALCPSQNKYKTTLVGTFMGEANMIHVADDSANLNGKTERRARQLLESDAQEKLSAKRKQGQGKPGGSELILVNVPARLGGAHGRQSEDDGEINRE